LARKPLVEKEGDLEAQLRLFQDPEFATLAALPFLEGLRDKYGVPEKTLGKLINESGNMSSASYYGKHPERAINHPLFIPITEVRAAEQLSASKTNLEDVIAEILDHVRAKLGIGLEIVDDVEGPFVKSIPGQILSFVALGKSNPTNYDMQYAKRLPPEIHQAAVRYISKPEIYFRLDAARKIGDYILLDVGGAVRDGNKHLVYDSKKKKVIGQFLWYPQG